MARAPHADDDASAGTDGAGQRATPAMAAFARLTSRASRLLGAPVTLTALVDGRPHTFGGDGPAAADSPSAPAGAAVPAVVVADGTPQLVLDGVAIGQFTVAGPPRAWVADDIRVLHELTEAAVAEIELHADLTTERERLADRDRELADLARRNEEIRRSFDVIDEHVYTGEFLEDGTVVRHSSGPGVERFLGGPPPDGAPPAQAWIAAIHPDDRPVLDGAHAVLREGRPHEMRYRMVGQDGHTRHVLERCRLRDDRGDTLLFDGVVVDLTAVVEADAERELAVRRRDAAFSATPTGMAIVKFGTRVLEVNDAFVRITGYHPDEIQGRSLLDLAHPRDRFRLVSGMSATRLPGAAPFEVEHPLVHRHGHEIWARIHVTPVPTIPGDEPLYLIQLHDATETRQAEDRLRRSEQRFRAIFETAVDGILTFGRDGRITSSNAAAGDMFGYVADDLVGRPFVDLLPPEERAAHAAEFGRPTATAEGFGRRAVELTGVRRDGTRFPMALSIGDTRLGDDASATAVIRDVGAERRAEAEKAALALAGLEALAAAIDAKDASTKQHSDRVAELAEALAIELGWSTERAATLRQAGLVHDVGKIGVPDAILSKPSRLTDLEYERIKLHAPLGADIVSGVLNPEQISWIRHHHERPDGRGYPEGLTGDAVPDGARILALADSWDVMTAARPYKLPMSVADALAECRRCEGTQFDAAVVEALCSLLAGQMAQAA